MALGDPLAGPLSELTVLLTRSLVMRWTGVMAGDGDNLLTAPLCVGNGRGPDQ